MYWCGYLLIAYLSYLSSSTYSNSTIAGQHCHFNVLQARLDIFTLSPFFLDSLPPFISISPSYTSQLFLEFDTTPLAAASLGQVHRAVLRPNAVSSSSSSSSSSSTSSSGSQQGGLEVAVKVQREGLRAIYDLDLALLGKVGFVLHSPLVTPLHRFCINVSQDSAKSLI